MRSILRLPISARYREGIWARKTGSFEWYRNLGTADNDMEQCDLEEEKGHNPSIRLNLNYVFDPDMEEYELFCPNADAMIGRAKELCGEYLDFYETLLVANAAYLVLFSNDRWKDYGFEIRLNRLISPAHKVGDGLIYDNPVTLTAQ